MSYQVIGHGGGIFSIVHLAGREGRPAQRQDPPIRTRVLVQLMGGKPVVIRGSLIIGRDEVRTALREEGGH